MPKDFNKRPTKEEVVAKIMNHIESLITANIRAHKFLSEEANNSVEYHKKRCQELLIEHLDVRVD